MFFCFFFGHRLILHLCNGQPRFNEHHLTLDARFSRSSRHCILHWALWLFRHIVKTRGGWQLLASDLLAEAHRETDCQRQTEPWGGCNEYAAPYGVDDLINNHKLSQWPGLLGAALCARANGSEFSGRWRPQLAGETARPAGLPGFPSHAFRDSAFKFTPLQTSDETSPRALLLFPFGDTSH